MALGDRGGRRPPWWRSRTERVRGGSRCVTLWPRRRRPTGSGPMSGRMDLREVPAPARRDAPPNLLADLLRSGVRPWWSVADRLSTAVTAAFWGLAFLNGIFAGWL